MPRKQPKQNLFQKRLAENKKIASKTKEFWQTCNINVEPDYHHPEKIYQLQLNFSDYEWVNLLNKEGEFLDPCCSQISFIRDKLQDVLREDGWLKAGDLEELALTIKSHDSSWEVSHPLQKLLTLYEQVKDHLVKGTDYGRDTVDLQDPESCLRALARYAGLYDFHGIFSNNSPERQHHSACCREHLLLDLEPVIDTLHHKLRELSLPQSGYGLFDENGDLAYSTQGVAIYQTQKIAEEICQAWNENEHAMPREEKKHYTVHFCTVSLDKGVQIKESTDVS